MLGLSDLTPIWEFHTTLFKLFEPFTFGKRVKKYWGSYRQITGYNFETRVVKHDSVVYITQHKRKQCSLLCLMKREISV